MASVVIALEHQTFTDYYKEVLSLEQEVETLEFPPIVRRAVKKPIPLTRTSDHFKLEEDNVEFMEDAIITEEAHNVELDADALLSEYDDQWEEEKGEPEPELPEPKSYMPQFPGGKDALKLFLERNLIYPASAPQSRRPHEVIVSFTVNPDGTISNIKVLRGGEYGFGIQAIKTVKAMPK